MVSHPRDFLQSSSEPATHSLPVSVHLPLSLHIVDAAQCSGFVGKQTPLSFAPHRPKVAHVQLRAHASEADGPHEDATPASARTVTTSAAATAARAGEVILRATGGP